MDYRRMGSLTVRYTLVDTADYEGDDPEDPTEPWIEVQGVELVEVNMITHHLDQAVEAFENSATGWEIAPYSDYSLELIGELLGEEQLRRRRAAKKN